MDDSIIPKRPSFLDRVPDDARTVRCRKTWRQTPAMKKQAKRDAEKRAKIAARPIVFQAVETGAETFGQVRKATGLDPMFIRSALRFYIHNSRAICKNGRRYFVA